MGWLQQPLPDDQPDPGPLNVSAVFKTEGEKVVLEEALISGDALDAIIAAMTMWRVVWRDQTALAARDSVDAIEARVYAWPRETD